MTFNKKLQAGFTPLFIPLILLAGVIVFLVVFSKTNFGGLFSKPLELSISEPTQGQVLTEGVVKVTGVTSPGATVVFYNEEFENSLEAGSDGNFSGDISLSEGINTLVITSFGKDGQEKTQTLDLVYDSEASN